MASQAAGPSFVGLGHLHAFFLPQIVSAKCLARANVPAQREYGRAGCLLFSGLVEIDGAKLLRMFLSPAH